MDIRQAINLALFGRFAHEGTGFAHPTQTVTARMATTRAERMMPVGTTDVHASRLCTRTFTHDNVGAVVVFNISVDFIALRVGLAHC